MKSEGPLPGFDPAALALLRCPATGARLRISQGAMGPELVAEGVPDAPRYPVVNGIPVLLPPIRSRPKPGNESPDGEN